MYLDTIEKYRKLNQTINMYHELDNFFSEIKKGKKTFRTTPRIIIAKYGVE